MNRIWFILVASLLLLSCNKQTPEKEVLPRTQKERVRWFEEARLGIMHCVLRQPVVFMVRR